MIGTATTVAEARAWEEAGADFVCVSLGGGRAPPDLPRRHRAILRRPDGPAAAGGGGGEDPGDRRRRHHERARHRGGALLGAQAAQLGTAFLCSPESGIAEAWRAALRNAGDDSTRLTRAFSGRPARGIVNDFMCQMRAEEAQILPYPVQNALTGDIRQAAAKAGRGEFMSLWAGQGVGAADAGGSWSPPRGGAGSAVETGRQIRRPFSWPGVKSCRCPAPARSSCFSARHAVAGCGRRRSRHRPP